MDLKLSYNSFFEDVEEDGRVAGSSLHQSISMMWYK